MTLTAFRKLVWDYYKKYGRELAWRKTQDPYRILVSEVMLQQTQVSRVEKKYPEFLKAFSNFKALAVADTAALLKAWQGMGYNRRALNLRKSAQIVVSKYKGKLPRDIVSLDALPGIGPNTAGSIAAFAFNLPVVFIETNIRRVFIHHFFPDAKKVHDTDILKLVARTIDKERPREWYFALMDYGAHLASKISNPNRRSAHYAKQAKFEGSDRQIRGKIVRHLTASQSEEIHQLQRLTNIPVLRLKRILLSLQQDGFVSVGKRRVYLIP